jgi:hypothetical protein
MVELVRRVREAWLNLRWNAGEVAHYTQMVKPHILHPFDYPAQPWTPLSVLEPDRYRRYADD